MIYIYIYDIYIYDIYIYIYMYVCVLIPLGYKFNHVGFLSLFLDMIFLLPSGNLA